MVDIVTVIGVWFLSLVSAFISVRQPKGVDWYAPISNKIKMIMTFINISVVLVVIVLLLCVIPTQLWKILVVSVVCIILISFLCFKRAFKSNNSASSNSYDKNLLDNICKLLTVFNSAFAILNIVYMAYIYYLCGINKIIVENQITPLEGIFGADSALVVHGTILFWSAISMTVITAKSWNIKEENGSENNRKVICTAKFYAKRITNRNRT